ncbi:MAG: hypothetical protein AB8B84_11570 [Granulosicoccus sp.]
MNSVRKALSSCTVLRRVALTSLVALILSLVSFTTASAQALDTTGPVIELEELAEGEANFTQVFTVQIVDDVNLKDATLYYRREGQLPFTPARMQALGDTGYFSVSIPTDNTDLRTIEYYVQARDEAGNRTVSGFAFDPYQRRLTASSKISTSLATEQSVVLTPAQQQPEQAPSIFQNRWVQVTLGVLAVGVLASMASSGGSDSQVVPLTFNLQ